MRCLSAVKTCSQVGQRRLHMSSALFESGDDVTGAAMFPEDKAAGYLVSVQKTRRLCCFYSVGLWNYRNANTVAGTDVVQTLCFL